MAAACVHSRALRFKAAVQAVCLLAARLPTTGSSSSSIIIIRFLSVIHSAGAARAFVTGAILLPNSSLYLLYVRATHVSLLVGRTDSDVRIFTVVTPLPSVLFSSEGSISASST